MAILHFILREWIYWWPVTRQAEKQQKAIKSNLDFIVALQQSTN